MDKFGQIIIMNTDDGDFEAGVKAAMREMVSARGIPLNHLTEEVINKLASEEAKKVRKAAARGGIPGNLHILLGFKEKRRAIAWIKQMTISMDDLIKLILNCHKKGYTHRKLHKDVIPEKPDTSVLDKNIRLINTDREIVFGDRDKILKQIKNSFSKRRYSTAHLFEKGDEWHMFCFDHNEIYLPQGPNHYKDGPHVHYMSYLWGRNLDKEDLWNQLAAGKRVNHGEHLKLIQNKITPTQINTKKALLERITPHDVMKLDDDMMVLRTGNASLDFKVYKK